MTHIMKINEFFLFKNKNNKPKEEIKVEKSDTEIFLEKVKKDAEPIKYDKVVEEFEKTFEKEFDKKMISDFSNANWSCYDKSEESVDDMLDLIPTTFYNEIVFNKEYYGNKARFYRFDVVGENNTLDLLCILAWDYPTKGEEEEEDEYTYCLYIAINSKKTNA